MQYLFFLYAVFSTYKFTLNIPASFNYIELTCLFLGNAEDLLNPFLHFCEALEIEFGHVMSCI